MFAPSLIRVKSLETPVTRHCNLRCAACDHASSYLSKSFLDAGQFERDLNVLKKAMTADEFRMVGGEPLQHPELETLIEIVRRSGIAGRVVLVTNGVLLDKASDRLWQSIDRLWLSIYPGVSLGLPLDEIEARCRENNVVLDARPTHQFRVVLVNNRIEDKPRRRDLSGMQDGACLEMLHGAKRLLLQMLQGVDHAGSPPSSRHIRG
jgi:organic radical activating enzyme